MGSPVLERIGSILSLNKPRKWDKVLVVVTTDAVSVMKLEYTSEISFKLSRRGQRCSQGV